jgi:hypothetical protein
MNLVRSGLIFGFLVWAIATAVFVPLGHAVFGPDNRLPVPLATFVIVLGTFGLANRYAVRVLRGEGEGRLERSALLGVCVCLPGLILDGVLYALGSGRYPGLDGPASGTMSAGLLFAYAAALLGTLDAARASGGEHRLQGMPGTKNA